MDEQPLAAPSGLTSSQARLLAHPMRARLWRQLRQHSAASATDLARELDTNSGATSYHLRLLAEGELIEPAPGGRGRRRLWRARNTSVRFAREGFDSPDSSAQQWLEHDYIAHFAERAERWIEASPTWPPAWRHALGTDDAAIIVTAEQAGALRQELAEVIARYRRSGAGNPTARRVAVYTSSYPLDLDRIPLAPASGGSPTSSPGSRRRLADSAR